MFGSEHTISEILRVFRFDIKNIAFECAKCWLEKHELKSVLFVHNRPTKYPNASLKKRMDKKDYKNDIDWLGMVLNDDGVSDNE